MKKEKLQSSVLSVSGFLVFLGILAAVNFIAGFIFFRLDLTSNRIYSLSKFSKQLVKSLDDPVIIKAYFSKELPPQYDAYKKYLQQLLDEYKVYSKGNVTVNFVRYDDDKKFEMEAQRQDIPPLRFDQMSHDKYEVQVAYMGLAIHYIDKREVIPVIKSIQGLEYDITSRIRRLVSSEKTKVGFLTGHGEIDIFEGQDELQEIVERDYEIFKADLQGATTFPADMACLLVIGPAEKLSETDLFAVDQYLMNGKPAAVCAGLKKADLDSFRVETPAEGLGIENLTAHYGVIFKEGLVIDPQCQRIAVTQQQGFFSIQNIVDFMYVPQIVRISNDNPMIKDLNSLSLPFVSPLEINLDAQPEVTATELLSSSKHSWIQEKVGSINPFERLAPPEAGIRGEKLLGVILEGSWRSYYKKNTPPSNVDTEQIIKQGSKTRLVVIGTGAMFESGMPAEKSNFTFLVNMIDWLTQDEGLIAIRSKGVAYQAIEELSSIKRTVFKWLNILLMPFGIAGLGLFTWRRRKKYKEHIALKYKAGEYVN
ncbi:MAG: Gldg family protein [bacterium]